MDQFRINLAGELERKNGDSWEPVEMKDGETLSDLNTGQKLYTDAEGKQHVCDVLKMEEISVKDPDSLERGLKQIQDTVQSAHRTQTEIKNLAGTLNTFVEKFAENGNTATRKSQYQVDAGELIENQADARKVLDSHVAGTKFYKDGNGIITEEAPNTEKEALFHEFQQKSDRIYLLSKVLGKKPTALKAWEDFERFTKSSGLQKALSTGTSGSGADWVPDGFSARLWELVRLQRRVAGLFEVLPMTQKTLQANVQTSDASAYYITENTDDEGTKHRASTPGTSNFTLTKKKMAVRIVTSDEEVEDSIVPVLPFIERQLAQALANGQEQALIDGDDTATHMDADVTDSQDVRKMWKGLRKLAIDKSSNVDFSGAVPVATNLVDIMQKMGKPYNTMIDSLLWCVSSEAYIQLLLDSTSLLTVDKYGQRATVVTGELGRVWNIPLVISQYNRADLHSSGVYTVAGQTTTTGQLIYRPGFVFGSGGAIQIDRVPDPERDQTRVVAKMRMDFADCYGSSEKSVASGYNMASS